MKLLIAEYISEQQVAKALLINPSQLNRALQSLQDEDSREKDAYAEDLDGGHNSGVEQGAELVRHVEVQPGDDDQREKLETQKKKNMFAYMITTVQR